MQTTWRFVVWLVAVMGCAGIARAQEREHEAGGVFLDGVAVGESDLSLQPTTLHDRAWRRSFGLGFETSFETPMGDGSDRVSGFSTFGVLSQRIGRRLSLTMVAGPTFEAPRERQLPAAFGFEGSLSSTLDIGSVALVLEVGVELGDETVARSAAGVLFEIGSLEMGAALTAERADAWGYGLMAIAEIEWSWLEESGQP